MRSIIFQRGVKEVATEATIGGELPRTHRKLYSTVERHFPVPDTWSDDRKQMRLWRMVVVLLLHVHHSPDAPTIAGISNDRVARVDLLPKPTR